MNAQRVGLIVAALLLIASIFFYIPWSFLHAIQSKQGAIGSFLLIASIIVALFVASRIPKKPRVSK